MQQLYYTLIFPISGKRSTCAQYIVSYTKPSAMLLNKAEQPPLDPTLETNPLTGIPAIRAALRLKFDTTPLLTNDQIHLKDEFARTESYLDAQNRLVQNGNGAIHECTENHHIDVFPATLARLIVLFDTLPLEAGGFFYCDVIDDLGIFVQRADIALNIASEIAKLLSAIDPKTCLASVQIADLVIPSKVEIAGLDVSDEVKRELLQQVSIPQNQSHYRIKVTIRE
jgi:hypothetical protein